jgi:DNA-binding response OmpR family regulator
MKPSEAEILLIDCNPRERTGDSLETILKSSRLPARLRREVIVDSQEIQFDWDRFDGPNEPNSFLVFLILQQGEIHQGEILIQSIKLRHPDVPIIVVIEDCSSQETLELLQRGASDFVTPPLRAADTLPRAWRLLDKFRRRESMMDALKAKVGLNLMIGKDCKLSGGDQEDSADRKV